MVRDPANPSFSQASPHAMLIIDYLHKVVFFGPQMGPQMGPKMGPQRDRIWVRKWVRKGTENGSPKGYSSGGVALRTSKPSTC